MSNRITEVLNGILAKFESGDIPKAEAISMFPKNDMPSSNWSFLNRLIMCISGTADARGFRQWQQVESCQYRVPIGPYASRTFPFCIAFRHVRFT